MVNNHADMLVPGSKESRFAHARSNASCTRSSARSTLPQSERANARSEGTADSITSRTGRLGGGIRTPQLRFFGPYRPPRRLIGPAREGFRRIDREHPG